MTSLIPPSTPEHEAVLRQRRDHLLRELEPLLVNQPASVVWEVGCGHGHYLAAYAQAHPDALCIGVDISSERIERADRKRERANLSNLAFLRADARLFLEVLPATVQLSAVFVLFPDPWPKSRHHKHRVIQPAFLASVACRMTVGGRLFFRTDHLPYFSDTQELIGSHPAWVLTDGPWPFEQETVFQSRAEVYHSLVARVRTTSRVPV